MAECPKCDGEGWLWRHELPEPHYEDCGGVSDDTKYTCPYCAGSGDAARKIERLRVEVETLKQRLSETERENEELRRRSEDLADLWQNGMRYIPERNSYEAVFTAHQLAKARRDAERLSELVSAAFARGEAALRGEGEK